MTPQQAYHRAYYLKNRDVALAKAKAAYAADPKKREAARKAAAARWEKLNPERRSALRAKVDLASVPLRPEVCDVCGKKPRGKAHLHLDHCHTNRHFRGWLCHHCNTALGQVQDDPSVLRKLANYLESKS